MPDANAQNGGGDAAALDAGGKDADQNFGSAPVGSGSHTCGSTSSSSAVSQSTSWIEIKLIDQDGNPVPGEEFSVQLPDGSPFDGYLDDQGFYRLEGIDPGTCQVTFPNFDTQDWKRV